jgi:hypothetical protein
LFPVGIIRIGFSAHFGMPLNWGQTEIVQPHCLWLCVSSLDSIAIPIGLWLGVSNIEPEQAITTRRLF